MEQYILFVVLKDIIKDLSDNKYAMTFNDMDFNKPNSIGVYIKGGEVSQYRELSTGNYYNYINRVQLVLQGDRTNESLVSLLKLATRIRSYMVLLSNASLDVPENKNIEEQGQKIQFGLVKLLGEVNFNNKTSQGLPVYSINFKFQYTIRR